MVRQDFAHEIGKSAGRVALFAMEVAAYNQIFIFS